eukprot:scaffold290883_cov35-Tisochrysis_lutea.AAC.2
MHAGPCAAGAARTDYAVLQVVRQKLANTVAASRLIPKIPLVTVLRRHVDGEFMPTALPHAGAAGGAPIGT